MDFKKIKFDGVTVTLEQVEEGAQWDRTITVNSREEPHPDFVAALAGLLPAVLSLCELSEDYAEGMRVQSVSISRDADGNRGCVVTSLKTLSGVPAPLVLNTPHVSEREDTHNRPTMPHALADALDTLLAEARAYVGGKRAQADLFEKAAA